MADSTFLAIKNRDDLQRLVDEGLEESLVLDYKASPALSRESSGIFELCKDVSAFANSAGGQIIYGVEENKATRKPIRIDDGVEDPKITREWIEQILNSRVQPRMDGIRIERIPIATDRFGYVVTIPPTQRGPHQSPDLKYYKRFELQSVPMQDYEIRDVMRRSATPQPFVSLSFLSGDTVKCVFDPNKEMSRPIPIFADISNRSTEPALYTLVTIGIDEDFSLVSRGSYQDAGVRRKDEANFILLREQWPVSQRFPIFKEATFKLADVPFSIALPSKYLGHSTRFYIFVEVQTPGFSSNETWYVACNGARLKLLPPRSN